MVQFGYIASTVVMGALLVLVFLFTEGRERRASPAAADRDSESSVLALANSPSGWFAAFIGFGVVLAGATAVYVGAFGLTSSGGAGLALGIVFALLFAGYALLGTYSSARASGFGRSQAAAMGVWAVGLLILVAVAVRLLTTG